MHTTRLEMTYGDMKSNLNQMIQVLQHGSVLQNDVDAQNAVTNILNVSRNLFTTCDVCHKKPNN